MRTSGAFRYFRPGGYDKADQKSDLQYDGLRCYAERGRLEVVRDYYDVGVSGRRKGRP